MGLRETEGDCVRLGLCVCEDVGIDEEPGVRVSVWELDCAFNCATLGVCVWLGEPVKLGDSVGLGVPVCETDCVCDGDGAIEEVDVTGVACVCVSSGLKDCVWLGDSVKIGVCT
jgi:hypothetical protein